MCDFSRFGGPSEEWLNVEKSLPSPASALPLDQLKELTNQTREATAAIEFEDVASLIVTEDHSVPMRDGFPLQARTYRPRSARKRSPIPVYIHFHGGGFLFGTLSSEDAICGRIAAHLDILVLNINYRHTPEYTYPTAWQDAEDAVEWAFQNTEALCCDRNQIIVGGISAGGNLSASLTLQRKLKGLSGSLRGQLLLIPNLAHIDCYGPQTERLQNKQVSSLEQNKDAPILPVDKMRFFSDLLKVEKPDDKDVVLSPGNATGDDVKGLPPTVIVVAGVDPIRDEGLLYGKLLADNGYVREPLPSLPIDN